MSEDLMKNINRGQATQNNQEIPTSYEWILQFTHKPNIVFMPNVDLMDIRLKSVNITGGEPSNSLLSTELRSFKVHQPALQPNSGSLTLNYQDFEDQAIVAYIQDWMDKCNTRDTRRSAHKRDLYCDAVLTRLNSFRQPINKYVCETGLPSNGAYGDQYTSEKSLIQGQSITIQFEFMQKKLLNLI